MPSTIPLSGPLVTAILKGFTRKPYKGDDTWEDCSIGVAVDSVVATDSYSAILIGRDATDHVATLRKEVVIECTRAGEYGDPVEIDVIPRNIDQSSGAAKQMPNARGEIVKRLSKMRSIAQVSPEALVAIGKVASVAGAISVELLQPDQEEEGENTAIGFRFRFYPDSEHINLFSAWEGPIDAMGVFKATKGDRAAPEPDEQLPETEDEEPQKPKRGRRAAKPEAAAPVEVGPDMPPAAEQVEEEPVDLDESIERDGYHLPRLATLSKTAVSVAESGDYGSRLLDALRAFNLTGRLLGVDVGPTVSLYRLEIPASVKIAKYLGLSADLAMRLEQQSIRLERLPGQNAIGVEIPNKVARTVDFLDLCARRQFVDAEARLTIALGEDIGGKPVYADLTKMPHLLVAGATNSGKSIGLASIITSLLMRNTPKECRFVMIDPKRVELTLFDNVPHQMCPVIRDVKEAAGVLRALWREMDRRYELLSKEGVRNIDGWNAKASFADRMPYIVLVIDELADLMMAAGAEVETVLVRLAQMARAVGIHMVIATQSPRADVVTGLIKANVPSRIAFAVASQVDSRVILDSGGAEQLLGKGDMLFLPMTMNRAVRVQGAFVSESDVAAVCSHWRAVERPQYEISFEEPDPERRESGGGSDSEDSLYDEAVAWVRERGQASTSMLQRKFTIGFQRASKLLDRMETEEVVGPRDGPRPRTVLPVKAGNE